MPARNPSAETFTRGDRIHASNLPFDHERGLLDPPRIYLSGTVQAVLRRGKLLVRYDNGWFADIYPEHIRKGESP